MIGNDAAEAYTASLRGVGLSHVIEEIAEVETVPKVEGYMCGTDIARGRSLCRGLRPHHASKEHVGTQEALSRPPGGSGGSWWRGKPGAIGTVTGWRIEA